MKDLESAESKEKLNFQFLFFELWSFFSHVCDVITPIFDSFFTITRKIKIEKLFFILSSTLRIFHKNGIKTEGRGRGEAWGGLHILSWDRAKFSRNVLIIRVISLPYHFKNVLKLYEMCTQYMHNVYT